MNEGKKSLEDKQDKDKRRTCPEDRKQWAEQSLEEVTCDLRCFFVNKQFSHHKNKRVNLN